MTDARHSTAAEIQARAERHAMALGLTMEEYGKYCEALIVKRHVDPADSSTLLRCPECGGLWPCNNEVTFLRGLNRGRELSKEHGWDAVTP